LLNRGYQNPPVFGVSSRHFIAHSPAMRAPFLLAVLLITGACGDAGEPTKPSLDERLVTVSFAAKANGKSVGCGKILEHLGSDHRTAEIEDFRLYVSNVRLLDEAGAEVPLTLIANDTSQSEQVALIDFEDGTGPCQTGTELVNAEIRGHAADMAYTGVVFEIGVPGNVNHADPALAKPPLDAPGMSWGWELGYKFLKLELGVKDSTNGFSFHVGSTGCVLPEGAARADTVCDRDNRATIRLENFDPDTQTISFDLAALVATSEVGTSSCQSFPESASSCAPLYARLGIDFATGACVKDCAEQQVFLAE
jgi:uncharacterized repeat protein (TIGR04052 family)